MSEMALHRPADRHDTVGPVLDLHLPTIRSRYAELAAALPGIEIAYAVKANPHPQVLSTLASLGSSFDIASAAELDAALAAGAAPERIEFSHPIKPISHLHAACAAGVRRFTADDEHEIDKIAEHCPGSLLTVRVEVDHHGAAWPLADKFGTSPDAALALIVRARDTGLAPVGVTFHCGSQQRNPASYTAALTTVGAIFRAAAAAGIHLTEVNIGGGLPAFAGADNPPATGIYAEAILSGLDGFPHRPHLVCEPGRYLVGDAGTLTAHVIGTAVRRGMLWVYLDAGVYQGLGESGPVGTRFDTVEDIPGPLVPAILAGPTCDSVDVLYDREPQQVPQGITAGHRLRFHGVGAYCVNTSTEFNGFPAPVHRITGD